MKNLLETLIEVIDLVLIHFFKTSCSCLNGYFVVGVTAGATSFVLAAYATVTLRERRDLLFEREAFISFRDDLIMTRSIEIRESASKEKNSVWLGTMT